VLLGSLFKALPVGMGFFDVTRLVFGPFLLDFTIQIEVELAID